MDRDAQNYNPIANLNIGCTYIVFGCTLPTSPSYNHAATADDAWATAAIFYFILRMCCTVLYSRLSFVVCDVVV